MFVRLSGGVGNQLFQVAAGASIGGLHHVRVLPSRSADQLALSELAPNLSRTAGRFEGRLVRRVLAGTIPLQRSALAVALLGATGGRRVITQGNELADAFAPRPAEPGRPRLLNGYFQHPTWFANGLDEVTRALVAAAPTGLQHQTVVHARGGEYGKLGWLLREEYYRRAIAELGKPGALHVVSDDAGLAHRISNSAGEAGWDVSVSSNSAVEDFWAIAHAANLVMSNSSFSWWAATVGDLLTQPEVPRTVTFPKGWVNGYGDVLRAAHWLEVESN